MNASNESFQDASQRYREWIEQYLVIDPKEWKKRETQLAESSKFEFLRATFFRWAQWWSEKCEDLTKDVPLVLGVGDLHLENFGTWRDGEGRLVWGVNDFDECCYLPYTNDLVRLAASTYLAIEEQEIEDQETAEPRIKERFESACRALLYGYCSGLEVTYEAPGNRFENPTMGRKPFVLAEEHDWLRKIALFKLREKKAEAPGADAEDDFDEFWTEMQGLKDVTQPVPRSAWAALHASMPEANVPFQLGKRDAGRGSQGRLRFTAVVNNWCGAILVREAKALAPSAWRWYDPKAEDEILYEEALRLAVRARDPWLSIHLGPPRQNWVVRRLAPDSGKVKLKDLRKFSKNEEGQPEDAALEVELWCAMGREIANVHVPLGNVKEDLTKRNSRHPDWLIDAARQMVEYTVADWETRER